MIKKFTLKTYHKLLWIRNWYFRFFGNMPLHPSVRISFKARMDKTNPKFLFVDQYTYIAFDAIVLAHDFASRKHSGSFTKQTRIGKCCFIGCGSIILPGVTIGDHVIVGAGSVVTRDVPPNCIVAGNPAKILKCDIKTELYGRLAITRTDE